MIREGTRGKKGKPMNLAARLIFISTIIVTITDIVEYIHIKQNPEHLTVLFLMLVILVTIVPMAINFWFHTGEQLNLTARLIAISTIIVTITDGTGYLYLKQNPERLTIPFLILGTVVTVIPIAINIWFHTR
jgi:hypothetical protein